MTAFFLETLVRFYQRFFSFWLGGRCRFYPSCSEYFRMALRQYPLGRALLAGGKRLLKCHPFHSGGIDLP